MKIAVNVSILFVLFIGAAFAVTKSRASELVNREKPDDDSSNIIAGTNGLWFASVGTNYSSDSDSVVAYGQKLETEYKAFNDLSFAGNVENLNMGADRESGLATTNGKEDISVQRLMIGAKHKYSDNMDIGIFGGVEIDSATESAIPSFEIKGNWKLAPSLDSALIFSRRIYAISPRSISLNVVRSEAALKMLWQASDRAFVAINSSYANFSDENKRIGFTLVPKYRVLQTKDYSFDAGVRLWWYGFSDRSYSGYYSPENYRSYNIPLIYTQKFGKHLANLYLAPGVYEDNNVQGFRFAGDVRAEAIFKVGDDSYLNLHADIVRSGGVTSSDYEGRSLGITLRRDF